MTYEKERRIQELEKNLEEEKSSNSALNGIIASTVGFTVPFMFLSGIPAILLGFALCFILLKILKNR